VTTPITLTQDQIDAVRALIDQHSGPAQDEPWILLDEFAFAAALDLLCAPEPEAAD
jgi:hypothetical protein